MAKKKKKAIDVRDLQGFKYFRMIADLFEDLKTHGLERDKAGNRELFFDQYGLLMLLYFFSPTVTSLRSLQQATRLDKVQRLCGVKKTSLGSLSEAAQVFDPRLLEPIITKLAARALATGPAGRSAKDAALAGLIAVDGSLLPAVSRMTWALWQDDTHRAAKMHVAFHVLSAVPTDVRVTAGNASEREELHRLVHPGGFYVADRGYADYSMFRDFDDAGARFVIRIQENAAFEVEQENPLSAADHAAGVVRDVTLRRLGTEKHNPLLKRPLRLVEVRGTQPGHTWLLATNAHDLSAELVALAYHHRWQIELFFRWMKCVLGCRHLVSESQSGVTLQVYFAIIATLLIGLWTGVKPNKRTYEMVCFYLSGWATAEELKHHLSKLQQSPGPPSKP